MCTLTALSVIHCTTLILQVETLQYCHLQYHFSDSTCRDTKFLAVHTIFRHCPGRKYLQNPASRWLQEMAPLWSKTAYDLDQASETADKSSKHLHQQQLSHPVHAVSHPKNLTRQHTTVSCYPCSGKHTTKDCQHQK